MGEWETHKGSISLFVECRDNGKVKQTEHIMCVYSYEMSPAWISVLENKQAWERLGNVGEMEENITQIIFKSHFLLCV